jgi:hypothetical protein
MRKLVPNGRDAVRLYVMWALYRLIQGRNKLFHRYLLVKEGGYRLATPLVNLLRMTLFCSPLVYYNAK